MGEGLQKGRDLTFLAVLRLRLGFPGGSGVKNLPVVQEITGLSLIWDDDTCQGATKCHNY